MSSERRWAQFRRDGLEGERFLALACAVLATASVAASFLGSGLLGPQVIFARALLFAFFTYGVVNLTLAWVHTGARWRWRRFAHATGVVLVCLVTTATGGAHSPFLILLLWALLAGADQWGMKGSLLTAGACVALLVAPSLVSGLWPDRVRVLTGGGGSTAAITGISLSLIIASYLLGYLVEEGKRQHANARIISRLIGNALPEVGLRATIESLMHSVRAYFDADQIRLVLRRVAGEEAFLWESKRPRGDEDEAVRFSKLSDAEREAYFATLPEAVWHSAKRRRPIDLESFGGADSPKPDGGRQGASWTASRRFHTPNDFGGNHTNMQVVGERHTVFVDFSSLLAVSFSYQREWFGRLLVYNSARGAFHQGDARFLEGLIREVAPAIYYMHHLGHLRSRARADERSRIAHELHDGVIQSLIGMEMQTAAVQREVAGDPSRLLQEIGRLQDLLRKEILELRERMHLLKPMEVEPSQLVNRLAETVDQFRREQAIAASFVSDAQEVSLPPRACSELVRILQEALVNIRKHSGARKTLVCFGRENGMWKLLVEDDGCGFSFAGRRSLAELDAASVGPRVIKERMRKIGGQLVIESVPGCGARLEISLLPVAYEQPV